MLLTNYMIDLASVERVVFMNQAVFTQTLRAVLNLPPKFYADVRCAHAVLGCG